MIERVCWHAAIVRRIEQHHIEAFTLDACVWASDWPFLKASKRIDYGPLLKLVQNLVPGEDDRHKLLWETPRKLFGFGA